MYHLTSASEARLQDIAQKSWLVENMLLIPKYEAWIHREVAVERAVSTTRIEGIGVEEPGGETDARLVEAANANALRAYEFVDYLSDLRDEALSELVVRQLNREFLHGAAATLTPGVYRKGQNTVGAYRPPDQGDVPELMRAFAAWLREGDDHPIVAAGLAHLHLVAIHPFWDGNGRTARALEALVLQRSDFHFRKLLSMEKRYLEVRPHYFAALERTLGTAFGDYDATPWLDFFLQMMGLEADRLIAQLTGWHHDLEALRREGQKVGVLDRQAEAVAFLLRTGHLTRADYIEVTGVSPVTASRDLADLVAKGWLIAEGATTSRRYAPSRFIAEALGRRLSS
jgi:Fic family protein